MVTFITAILVFSLIVVVHEFGHFIFARLAGVKVEEFAVGMGPLLVSTKKGDTVFSIRALPLGGFCKMLGEDDSNNDPQAFNNKPVSKRIPIILMGPVMNLILTFLIFSLVIMPIPTISSVVPDKPAALAGITAGDKIVAINGTEITEWSQAQSIISKSGGNNLNFVLENKGKTREVNLIPVIDPKSKNAIIGIAPSIGIKGLSFIEGFKLTANTTLQMFDFLGKLFQGKASTEEVVGPVGIIVFMNEAAKAGWIQVLYLTAILSLNLAIINLLPLPALDGGRLVFLTLEAIRRKPVNPDKEGLVHFVGFVLLMALSAVIIYRDLIKFNVFKIFG